MDGRGFKNSKIQLTIPVTDKITDYNEEDMQGSFYEQELQKTAQDTLRIEKVLKRQEDKSLVLRTGVAKDGAGHIPIEKVLKRQGDKSLVKWIGYPKTFNSWIDTKTILKLTTKKSL